MENAAAYTMLVLGGNAKPTADQVKAVVVAGGKAEPDEESIAALIKDMEGKELAAVIDAGMEKIKDVPMGGGGGGGLCRCRLARSVPAATHATAPVAIGAASATLAVTAVTPAA
mmetsp:Transcript_21052/g.59492  ORF Transcript_21052/g.59492 Transcript_21052/m.59492 type:complete len:114 (+) Transcript_21052:95-436(+)